MIFQFISSLEYYFKNKIIDDIVSIIQSKLNVIILKCLSDFPEFKILTFLESGFREAAPGMPSPVTRERGWKIRQLNTKKAVGGNETKKNKIYNNKR